MAVFRLIDHDMAFVEGFKRWEEYAAARRYWMASGYVVTKLWDLDYTDYIKEQNEANVGADA